MSQLTPHQQEKLDEIKELLFSQQKRRALVKGSAGVGKTWLVNTLIQELTQKTRADRILCSAPTHKALQVLRSKITVPEIGFSTAHSALSYKAITDSFTGEKKFVSCPHPNFPPLQRLKYWIIDEASMIDLEMLMCMEKHANQQGVIMILIGDDKQINPVGEDESPVFWGSPKLFQEEEEAIEHTLAHLPEGVSISYTEAYCPVINKNYVGFEAFPSVELTEIVRQGAGNPIIGLSRKIPDIWSREPKVLEEDTKGYLYTVNLAKIIEELAKENGSDNIKYLAWTNTEVDYINTLVRKRVYGDHVAKVELGESIIINSSYKSYNTNEEVKIEALERKTIQIDVITESGKFNMVREKVAFNVFQINEDILILEDSSLGTFRKYAAITSKNAKAKLLDFKLRNAFLDTFADFKYNHAITVHKSQGSTYKNVILNVGNIAFNSNLKEKQRLFYTGVTRASDLLILYNV